MKTQPMTCDQKCFDLAALFLGDEPAIHNEENTVELAELIQAAFDGCAECDRLKKHLREIGRWTADILNADRGAVDYQLREFAQDVYGEIHSALKENMPS